MAKTHGFGTTLTWNGVVVAGLTAINGIELSVDQIDVTTHQSTGGVKESMPGLKDYGDVSIEGIFDYTDATGQQAMLADAAAGEVRTGVITFPESTGTSWTFSGFVTSIKIGDATLDGVIPFSATIKVSGKPTFAVAASNNLSGLTVNTATLYPSFSASVYEYVATSMNTEVTVTPTASAGVITVNGATVASGNDSAEITVGLSALTTIVVKVTESGKTPKVYTIKAAQRMS